MGETQTDEVRFVLRCSKRHATKELTEQEGKQVMGVSCELGGGKPGCAKPLLNVTVLINGRVV